MKLINAIRMGGIDVLPLVEGGKGISISNGISSGNWQFTPTLSRGKHSIMAEATNSAGNSSLLSSALNLNV